MWSQIIVLTECRHDNPGVTAEHSGLWHWASSEFQVDGKNGAIEPSGLVKSSERKITPKHLVRVALRSEAEALVSHLEEGEKVTT